MITPPEPYQAPDTTRFIDPWSDSVLLSYYKSVQAWHGYVRFLGLPHLKDNPDVPLNRLFVEPQLTSRPVAVSPEANDAQGTALLQAIAEHPRLVILGDPGTGKSTIVNYLSWQQANQSAAKKASIDSRIIPVPLVLRELQVRRGVTWESLMEKFYQHAMNRDISGLKEKLEEQAAAGQVLFLLDGLDEISDAELRKDLRAAAFQGMSLYKQCRWVMTSRVVGYDEVEFHSFTQGLENVDVDALLSSIDRKKYPGVSEDILRHSSFIEAPVAQRLYVAPFSDTQIENFTRNFFFQRDPSQGRSEQSADDLLQKLSSQEHTKEIARIPNLLTLVCIIYRAEGFLPDGRTKLYSKVAEAYLESIDKSRNMLSAYKLEETRRWLGRVGFEMQRRRSDDSGEEDAGAILASRDEVSAWIADEMENPESVPDSDEVKELLDYLCRRSGLLLPRGMIKNTEQFAFLHLSFQEYFAAEYLAFHIQRPRWPKRCALKEAQEEGLQELANQSTWQETMVFLFELLATDPDWGSELLEVIYGENFERITTNDGDDTYPFFQTMRLLGLLAVNRFSGLTETLRDQAIRSVICWESTVDPTKFSGPPHSLTGEMLSIQEEKLRVAVARVFRGFLQSPHSITSWNLANTSVSDVSMLKGLTKLKWLSLKSTMVSDVGPLKDLVNLETLILNNTPVKDISTLKGLTKLKRLDLQNTSVRDVTSLTQLSDLHWLDLWNTSVSDITALRFLTNIQKLFLADTYVSDLSALGGITNLNTLILQNTSVNDISALKGLRLLEILNLANTSVSDLSSLKHSTSLQFLFLNNTSVRNVTPLKNLVRLNRLDLQCTLVSDISVLTGLNKLTWLDLRETLVRDVSALDHLRPKLNIYGVQEPEKP